MSTNTYFLPSLDNGYQWIHNKIKPMHVHGKLTSLWVWDYKDLNELMNTCIIL
jgi:hypothetical protein